MSVGGRSLREVQVAVHDDVWRDYGPVGVRMSVFSPVPDIRVVALDGELDTVSAPETAGFIDEQIASGPVHLILDLGGLSFMSSAGAPVLVDTRTSCQRHGVTLHLTGVRGHRPVEVVLSLTGTVDLFRVHTSLPDLLAELTSPIAPEDPASGPG